MELLWNDRKRYETADQARRGLEARRPGCMPILIENQCETLAEDPAAQL